MENRTGSADESREKEKQMPRGYVTPDGFGITTKARAYLAPLIQGEDYPPYANGLPRYARLKAVLAPQVLPPFV